MLPISDYKRIKRRNFDLVGKVKLKVLVVLATMVAVLFASQLVFANSLTEDGQKLSKMESEINKLEAENTTLSVQIAQVTSLTALSKKAGEMGFKTPQKIITP